MYSITVTLLFNFAFILLLQFSAAKECNRETLTQCIYEMEADLRLVTPDNELYNYLNSARNWRKNVQPTAFLVAQKTYDVQIGVKCLKKFKCPFTIKSGGNRFETDSFRGEPYYALDLSNLTKIEVYKKTMRAVIGAGASLSNVSNTLFYNNGFAVSGGILENSSFGGHVLSGGWSTSSRKYGLTSQNILEMTLVNADGEVLSVSPVEHKPLFFALRGAGQGNYGVVTDYSVRVFEAPTEVSVLKISYNFSDFKTAFEKWQTYANKFDESVTSLLIVSKTGIDLYSTINNEDKNMRIRLTNKVLSHFSIFGVKANIVNMNFNDMNNFFYKLFASFKIQSSKSNFVDKTLNYEQIEKLEHSLKSLFEKFPSAVNVNYEFGGKIESAFEDSAFIHTHHSYLFQLMVNEAIIDDSLLNETVANVVSTSGDSVNSGNGPQNPAKLEIEIGAREKVDTKDKVNTQEKVDVEYLKEKAQSSEESVRPGTVLVKKTIEVLDAENNVVKQKTVVVSEDAEKLFEELNENKQHSEKEKLVESTKNALKEFFDEISFMDSGHSYQCFGDDNIDISRFYGEYTSTLQRIKCIYDNENVFKHSHSIPLKCGHSHAYRLEL
ncbi:hypothetical protein B4U80_13183 [Leptotrombidium deliense]|uniref:FAD-binding PCMH-type domain-containing protein n=1 Tax=Leptotrombidium deliense TaxID=299467 RepID=A0A443SBC3_9ACAR|nr:hypothetical protein B4U80_13183 [Leptotrombidium deliense]